MKAAFRVLLATALLAQAASFQVSTVRINRSGLNTDSEHYHNDLVQMTNVTLKQCIRYAYEISEPQIAGGPKWMEDLRFDLVARADQTAEDFELLRMLQPVLVDRFQLVTHHETRQLPGYALTVAKGGIHAKLSDPGTHFSGSSTHSTMTVKACPMSILAIRLAAILKRPVADLTGDSRLFDIALQWTPDDTPSGGSSGADGASLFTALQEQVGVKLESRKVAADVLVVDRAEMPSEN